MLLTVTTNCAFFLHGVGVDSGDSVLAHFLHTDNMCSVHVFTGSLEDTQEEG